MSSASVSSFAYAVSAIIMSQEHSVLLFGYLLLLFRAENLCSVLSHGQAGVCAREQLSSPGISLFLFLIVI